MTPHKDVCTFREHSPLRAGELSFEPSSIPFRSPAGLHRCLDRNLGFMIYATVRKPCVA